LADSSLFSKAFCERGWQIASSAFNVLKAEAKAKHRTGIIFVDVINFILSADCHSRS